MISIIAPVFNEEENIALLHEAIRRAMDSREVSFEAIYIDDGSTDKSWEIMKKVAADDAAVKLVRLKKNYGQTAAIAAGIENATGDIIVSLDADLQNDPEDIMTLVDKVKEGFDVAAGWRVDRWKTRKFTRRLPSQIASRIISFITRIKLHDHGCPLKAYRREVFDSVNFTGDMHRMIVGYLALSSGVKVAEVPISCKPRKFGKSKYGISRTFKVLLDVLSFHFFNKYSSRPIHFFGIFGFVSFFGGFLSFILMLYLKYFRDTSFIKTPLPVLTALFIFIGVQFILMGLLAEIFIRTYAREFNGKSYSIKEKVNF